MQWNFSDRLRAGERLIGTMITLDSPTLTEIMARAGFDWLFIDGEHSPMSAMDIQRLLQGAGPDLPCLVRIAAAGELHIKKALDAGAAGIIAPMVNSAEQAREVVRLARYAPAGSRGVGLGRATGYGLDLKEHLARANRETVVVVQAEHFKAVENIAEIVKVEGVDAVLVGPFDLSASLGHIGEVNHPAVVEAIDQITETCQAAHVPLGIFGVSAAAVRPHIERGYSLIVAGADTLLLGLAAGELLAEVRGIGQTGTH